MLKVGKQNEDWSCNSLFHKGFNIFIKLDSWTVYFVFSAYYINLCNIKILIMLCYSIWKVQVTSLVDSLWNWPVLTRLNRVAQSRILNALVGICSCWSCSSEAKYSFSHLHVRGSPWTSIPFYSDLWKREKWFYLYRKTDPLYMVETSTMLRRNKFQ